METIERTKALFQYIRELISLKYNIVTDVEKQAWHYYLKDIPDDPDNIQLFYRDKVEEEADNDSTLLKVKKPNFKPCPQPSAIFREWLEPGWEYFQNEAKFKETLTEDLSENEEVEHKVTVHFEDSSQRVKAFKQWKNKRDVWVEEQLNIARTRKFFEELFKVYTNLERESETLELMIGNGMLREKDNSAIKHPLLFKRVQFQFDSKLNLISICDTDKDPELYTVLLRDLNGINHDVIRKLEDDDLRDNFYHPLDRTDTPDFLKRLTHSLTSDSRFINNENDEGK